MSVCFGSSQPHVLDIETLCYVVWNRGGGSSCRCLRWHQVIWDHEMAKIVEPEQKTNECVFNRVGNTASGRKEGQPEI